MHERSEAHAHLAAGRPAAAVHLLSDHLARAPEDAGAWEDVAEALLAMGHVEGALPPARRACQLDPRPEALALVALLLARLGHPDARPLLTRVSAARPRSARAWERIARTYESWGEVPAAIDARRTARSCAPDDVGVALRLAERLERADRRPEAHDVVADVLRRSPAHPEAERLLVRLEHHDGHLARAITRARSVVSSPALPAAVRAGLWMELARMEARLGRADEAFAAADEGNRRSLGLWQSAGGDVDRIPRDHAELLATELPSEPPPVTTLERRPPVAFVVGFPRSGTTLLQQVLEAHPDTHTLDELPLLDGALEEVLPGLSLRAAIVAADDPAVAARLREAWWRRARVHAPDDGRLLVDKQPLNLTRVDLLARVFPGAPILAIHRDPRDAVLSAWFQDFDLNPSTAQCADLGRCGRLYADALAVWTRALPTLPRAGAIRYEDLIRAPEQTLRPVLALLGLPWDPAVLDHGARRATVATPSYQDVRQPFFDRSIGRWRASAAHLAPAMHELAPWVTLLGYPSR